MKLNWKSEAIAAVSAFSLTGLAMWGSLIPIDTNPGLHGSERIAPAVMNTGQSATIAIREGHSA